jgi:hypothetical protein
MTHLLENFDFEMFTLISRKGASSFNESPVSRGAGDDFEQSET